MSEGILEQHTRAGGSEVHVRPVGMVKPMHDRAVRALVAFAENRLQDVETNISAIPDVPVSNRIWKLILRGNLAIDRGDCAAAEPVLIQAYGLGMLMAGVQSACSSPLAPIESSSASRAADFSPRECPGTSASEFVSTEARGSGARMHALLFVEAAYARLAALALEKLGVAYRRMEDTDNAKRAHAMAYRLRDLTGSHEELWQSACSLGTDADVAERHDQAVLWFRAAVEHAEQASGTSLEKQATAWQDLARSLSHNGDHGEAVQAARMARECWCRFDLGAVNVPKAELTLGHTLLKQGEHEFEQDAVRAGCVLDEAIEVLSDAREALLAFGPIAASDAELCTEQKDFAERLRLTLAG